MLLQKIHLYRLLLLILLAIQPACSTHLPLRPQSSEQTQEAETAQPGGNATVAIEPEPSSLEQQAQIPEKIPELVLPPPKPSFPESVLSAPETALASAMVKYDTVLFSRSLETPINSGWQYRIDRQKKIIGFEFSNRGGNAILPERYDIEKNRLFTRDFQFHFQDRARQDIHLLLTDWAPSRDKQFRLSELMNSIMLFFPRNYLPAIAGSGGHYVVTLPTGEEVKFDAVTREVLGGVFAEAPVDLHPDKTARKFPAVSYTGKGVMIRANARGTDPRLGTIATITSGSQASNCEGMGCNRCQVPSKELWEQNGAVRFKFATDEEFDRYLSLRCGFGLPKNGVDFVLAGQ
jgi:hypothetical protein